MARPTEQSISVKKKPKIDYSKYLAVQLQDYPKIPKPHFEYRFHETRKWRFDLAFPEQKLAVEIEGGIWQYGRHNRASTFIKDLEKYNNACMLGWYLLRFSTEMVKKGIAVQSIKEFMEARKKFE
jgi:very-short-patch-repair endonuclease